MSKAPFRVALLDASHDRSTFNSGTPALDRYCREQVSQDMRRRVATCFVALSGDQRIAPMATPNCSTVGQSNCSRQDGVIMRGLR